MKKEMMVGGFALVFGAALPSTAKAESSQAVQCSPEFPDIRDGQCFWKDPDNRWCAKDSDCKDLSWGANAICSDGYCTIGCSGDRIALCEAYNLVCGPYGECYDPLNDRLNCGGSGKECPDTAPLCRHGRCATSDCANIVCPSNLPNCFAGECYNAATDPLNCGKSGNNCPAEFPVCYLGDCVAASM